MRRVTAGPAMESLTSCQDNRTRVVVRTVTSDTAAPLSMESLTRCQANRTRVGARTVKRDIAGTGMELAWNHSQPIKPMESEWE